MNRQYTAPRAAAALLHDDDDFELDENDFLESEEDPGIEEQMSDINKEIAALEAQTDTPEEWSSEDDDEDENSSPNTTSYLTSPSGELHPCAN